MADEENQQPESWRRTGRCSSCVFFVVDFGDAPELFGHCKMHSRTGAVESTAWACPQYEPLAGFDDLTRSTSQDNLPPKPIGRGGARSTRRPRSRRGVRRAAVVRRRSGGDERAVAEAPATVVPPEMLAAFGEGEETLDTESLRDVLIDVIEDFIGIEDVDLADRWQGGTVVLQPEDPEKKPTEIPMETFFHKIVMVRDRLRVLEQKVNAHKGLDASDKVELQQYISRCYGSLTTFNVLFKHKEDRFSSK
ncbi:MAG: hypothetical protein ACQEXJ_15215 [Myxococcota bacterium]